MSVSAVQPENKVTVSQKAALRQTADQAVPATSGCDGVVCFAAVDWWYHNRGHSECQIMRRLASRLPVLWINSIGMRAPAPGKSDIVLRRYARKLRSTLKGLRRDSSGMWVYSPIFVPRYTDRMVSLNGQLLDRQVAWLLRKLGVQKPAAWVTVPTAVSAIERRSWSRVVFNRSDDFAAFPEANRAFVRRLEERLLARADDVVYVNRTLYEREQHEVRRAHYIGHGVDYEHFALKSFEDAVPSALRGVPRPIIGFYGALDGYTIDLELMIQVARAYRNATLVVIGPRQMDTSALEAERNVIYLGAIPYTELPAYARQFDVALMPWLQNEWIAACNPIKLKEYLAIGFPIVTTRFRELQRYDSLVYAADTREQFITHIGRALGERDASLKAKRRDIVAGDSWDALTDGIAELFGLNRHDTHVPITSAAD